MENNGTMHKIFIDRKKLVVHLRWRFCSPLPMCSVHPLKYLINVMYCYLIESIGEGYNKKNISLIYDNFLLTMALNEQKLYFPQLVHNFPLEHCTSNVQHNLGSLELSCRHQSLFSFDDVSLLRINVSTMKNSS
jgi:hypothetical protein